MNRGLLTKSFLEVWRLTLLFAVGLFVFELALCAILPTFFGELTDFMSSGPCVPVALEKENAVSDFRVLIGATNPAEADAGTIRHDFADSMGENIVHGSDSAENGRLESNYFFTEEEIVNNG